MIAKMHFYILSVALIFGVRAAGVPFDFASELTDEPTSNSEGLCDSDSFVKAINDFSSKISEKIGTGGNVFFSPFSIYTALAMAELGAGGKTKVEMQEVLGYGNTALQESDVYNGFRQLLSKLNESHGEYDLLAANGVFIQENYPIIRQYIEDLKLYFHSDVENVNFARSETIEIINSWVSDKTNGLISTLVDSGMDPLTRMVLLNAVYFKGTWETQFSQEATYGGRFYNGGNKKYVDMMSMMEERFLYFHDQEARTQYLRMPYKGDHIVMLFALPDGHNAPANLSINHDVLCHINSNLRKTKLDIIEIPKFKFEHTEELQSVLMDLGMKDLFSEGVANLTGITEERDVYVSSVLHKAVIEVDEEGSKAAAVTGIHIVALSASFNPSFIANHPFSFYIIDERNGMVLFAGKVSDP